MAGIRAMSPRAIMTAPGPMSPIRMTWAEESDGDEVGEFVEASPVLHADGSLRPAAAGEEQWGGEGDGDGSRDEEWGAEGGGDSGLEDEQCAVAEASRKKMMPRYFRTRIWDRPVNHCTGEARNIAPKVIIPGFSPAASARLIMASVEIAPTSAAPIAPTMMSGAMVASVRTMSWSGVNLFHRGRLNHVGGAGVAWG